MRLVTCGLGAAVLLSVFVWAAPPASGALELYASSIAAAPGTVSGVVTNLDRSDDLRVTFSEADVTANLNAVRWLRPSADDAPQWLKSGGCSTHTDCVDDNPVHDGNTTIVTSTSEGLLEAWAMEDWPGPTDISIDQLTMFVWGRRNSSASLDLGFNIDFRPADCALSPAGFTQAFENRSTTYTGTNAPSCDSTPWTIASVNAVVLEMAPAFPTGPDAVTVTATGAVVQYDDSDFQVVAYVNFTNVQGASAYDLDYECQTSLAGGDTLNLQVNRAGGWTTVQTGVCGAGADTRAQYNLDEAQDLINQAVQFRFVDTVTNEETGQSFAVDEFVIRGDPNEPPPPSVDLAGVISVRCEAGVWSITCIAELNASVPASIAVARTTWFLEGELITEGQRISNRSQKVELDAFAVTRTWRVTVQVDLTNTQSTVVDLDVRQDNTWLVVLVVFGIIAAIALVLLAKRRGPARAEPRENPRKDMGGK